MEFDKAQFNLILLLSYFKRKGQSVNIDNLYKNQNRLLFKVMGDSSFNMEVQLTNYFEKLHQDIITQKELNVILEVTFKVTEQDLSAIKEYLKSLETDS